MWIWLVQILELLLCFIEKCRVNIFQNISFFDIDSNNWLYDNCIYLTLPAEHIFSNCASMAQNSDSFDLQVQFEAVAHSLMKNKHYHGNLIRLLLKRQGQIAVLLPSGFLHFLCCQLEGKFHSTVKCWGAVVWHCFLINHTQMPRNDSASGVPLPKTICTIRNDPHFNRALKKAWIWYWKEVTEMSNRRSVEKISLKQQNC